MITHASISMHMWALANVKSNEVMYNCVVVVFRPLDRLKPRNFCHCLTIHLRRRIGSIRQNHAEFINVLPQDSGAMTATSAGNLFQWEVRIRHFCVVK